MRFTLISDGVVGSGVCLWIFGYLHIEMGAHSAIAINDEVLAVFLHRTNDFSWRVGVLHERARARANQKLSFFLFFELKIS